MQDDIWCLCFFFFFSRSFMKCKGITVITARTKSASVKLCYQGDVHQRCKDYKNNRPQYKYCYFTCMFGNHVGFPWFYWKIISSTQFDPRVVTLQWWALVLTGPVNAPPRLLQQFSITLSESLEAKEVEIKRKESATSKQLCEAMLHNHKPGPCISRNTRHQRLQSEPPCLIMTSSFKLRTPF